MQFTTPRHNNGDKPNIHQNECNNAEFITALKASAWKLYYGPDTYPKIENSCRHCSGFLIPWQLACDYTIRNRPVKIQTSHSTVTLNVWTMTCLKQSKWRVCNMYRYKVQKSLSSGIGERCLSDKGVAHTTVEVNNCSVEPNMKLQKRKCSVK